MLAQEEEEEEEEDEEKKRQRLRQHRDLQQHLDSSCACQNYAHWQSLKDTQSHLLSLLLASGPRLNL